MCECVCVGGGGGEENESSLWVKLSGCCVHCQQPVKMLRLSSGTCNECHSFLFIELMLCVSVCVGRGRRTRVVVGQAVWMLRPLSAACQDVASFVR